VPGITSDLLILLAKIRRGGRRKKPALQLNFL
jgi:hypothetical protein